MTTPLAVLLRRGLTWCLLAAALPFAQAELPSPMFGRQSNNSGIRAVPAPGAVKIDGDLSDWDLSGRIWSFADIAIRVNDEPFEAWFSPESWGTFIWGK